MAHEINVDDVVEVVWLDSGLHLFDATEEEARAAQLERVTVYGRVVFVDAFRLVLAMETGRGEAGTYGVIARQAVLRVRRLYTADENVDGTDTRQTGISGWV